MQPSNVNYSELVKVPLKVAVSQKIANTII